MNLKERMDSVIKEQRGHIKNYKLWSSRLAKIMNRMAVIKLSEMTFGKSITEELPVSYYNGKMGTFTVKTQLGTRYVKCIQIRKWYHKLFRKPEYVLSYEEFAEPENLYEDSDIRAYMLKVKPGFIIDVDFFSFNSVRTANAWGKDQSMMDALSELETLLESTAVALVSKSVETLGKINHKTYEEIKEMEEAILK